MRKNEVVLPSFVLQKESKGKEAHMDLLIKEFKYMYSFMDRGARRATVHGVAKSQTRLNS